MAASSDSCSDVSKHQPAFRLDNTFNRDARERLDKKKMTSGKSRSDEALDESRGAFHLPALRIKRPDGPITIKKSQYKRSTSADHESPKSDNFLLAPIVTSLRRGYSSEDINKSASDSALHVSISSISSQALDPFRQRSSSTSLTQSKGHQLVTPKISIDEYPEKGKIRREKDTFSSSCPLTSGGVGSHNSGNLTPPIDRSKKFPRSIRIPSSCDCQGLHEKGCPSRVLSRSMDNIHGNYRTELSVDSPRLSRLKQNLFPSYPLSAPSSPKGFQKSYDGNHRSHSSGEKNLTSPVTVTKSQLSPRARSQSAKNLRQVQIICPSAPLKKRNGRQPLPKLKLSDAGDGIRPHSDDQGDDRLFHPRDQNLLAPGRLEIRSPPLTDYSSDW